MFALFGMAHKTTNMALQIQRPIVIPTSLREPVLSLPKEGIFLVAE
jgi:hypothetical protein